MGLTNRYDSNPQYQNSNKKRVYSTILYPAIIKSQNDIYLICDEQDRLDLLSYKYYGDVRYWWIIAQANNLGKGGFHIPPGTRIRIPKSLDAILSDFDKINSTR